MTDKVFITCPATLVTGGAEALHQLADAINRATPGRAAIFYTPFRGSHQTPKSYHRYRVRVAHPREFSTNSTVVLPETASDIIDWFPYATLHYWWLSVDRFFTAAGEHAAKRLDTMRRRVGMHLYQSEYAREFLNREGLGPVARISDYLAEEYVRAAARPAATRRDDIVVYNPVKGLDQTLAILAAMDAIPHAVPLSGMSRNQVRRLLGRAKVYIDFGDHPGKDRIPREAAAMGAAVITNRRGSAGNGVDVPIPDEYKIDDTATGFEAIAAAKITQVMDDFAAHQPRFEPYRRTIITEPARFRGDVAAVYTKEPAYV